MNNINSDEEGDTMRTQDRQPGLENLSMGDDDEQDQQALDESGDSNMLEQQNQYQQLMIIQEELGDSPRGGRAGPSGQMKRSAHMQDLG